LLLKAKVLLHYYAIGTHRLMYLNTLLHGSHLVIQFGQTWHQLTHLSSGEKTGRQPL